MVWAYGGVPDPALFDKDQLVIPGMAQAIDLVAVDDLDLARPLQQLAAVDRGDVQQGGRMGLSLIHI